MTKRLNPYRVRTQEIIRFRGIFGEEDTANIPSEYVKDSSNLTSFRLRTLESRDGQEGISEYKGSISASRQIRTTAALCEGTNIHAEAVNTVFENKPSKYPWRSGFIPWKAEDLPDLGDLTVRCYQLQAPAYGQLIPENAQNIITPETWLECFQTTCVDLWEVVGSISGYEQVSENEQLEIPLNEAFSTGFNACYRELPFDLVSGDPDNTGLPDIPVLPPWDLLPIPSYPFPGLPNLPDVPLPPTPPELLECEPETISLDTPPIGEVGAGVGRYLYVEGYSESEIIFQDETACRWKGHFGHIQKITKSLNSPDYGDGTLRGNPFDSDEDFMQHCGGVSFTAKTDTGLNVVHKYDPSKGILDIPSSSAILWEHSETIAGSNTCEKYGKVHNKIVILPGFESGTVIRGTMSKFAGSNIEKVENEDGSFSYIMVTEFVTIDIFIAVGLAKYTIETNVIGTYTHFNRGASFAAYSDIQGFLGLYAQDDGSLERSTQVDDIDTDSHAVSSSIGWDFHGLNTAWQYASSSYDDGLRKEFTAPAIGAGYKCIIKVPYVTTNNADEMRIVEKLTVTEAPEGEDCDGAVQLFSLGASYWVDGCGIGNPLDNGRYLSFGTKWSGQFIPGLGSSDTGTGLALGGVYPAEEAYKLNRYNPKSWAHHRNSQERDEAEQIDKYMYAKHKEGQDLYDVIGVYSLPYFSEIESILNDLNLRTGNMIDYQSVLGDERFTTGYAKAASHDKRVATVYALYGDDINETLEAIGTGIDTWWDINFWAGLAYARLVNENQYAEAIVWPDDYDIESVPFPGVTPCRFYRQTTRDEYIGDNTVIIETTLESGQDVIVPLPSPECNRLPDLSNHGHLETMRINDISFGGCVVPGIKPEKITNSGFESGDVEVLITEYL